MNTPLILKTKEQLEAESFFRSRHENNMNVASIHLKKTMDPKMPFEAIMQAMMVIDKLVARFGPRFITLMLADTCNGFGQTMMEEGSEQQLWMERWGQTLSFLACDETLFCEVAEGFAQELLDAIEQNGPTDESLELRKRMKMNL